MLGCEFERVEGGANGPIPDGMHGDLQSGLVGGEYDGIQRLARPDELTGWDGPRVSFDRMSRVRVEQRGGAAVDRAVEDQFDPRHSDAARAQPGGVFGRRANLGNLLGGSRGPTYVPVGDHREWQFTVGIGPNQCGKPLSVECHVDGRGGPGGEVCGHDRLDVAVALGLGRVVGDRPCEFDRCILQEQSCGTSGVVSHDPPADRVGCGVVDAEFVQARGVGPHRMQIRHAQVRRHVADERVEHLSSRCAVGNG